MNIFFLTHWYPTPQFPVTGIFVQEHARAISLYHKVFVVHIQGIQTVTTDQQIIREQDAELSIFRIRYPKPRIAKTAWIQRLRLVNQVFNELCASGHRPDVIHANVYNTADLAAFLGNTHRIPAIMTEHSSAFPRHLIKGTKALSARFYINRLQLVMPVSENLITHMKEFGIKRSFKVVSNAVNCDLFYPGANKWSGQDGIPRILCVASLVEIKHHDLLLQSAKYLKEINKIFRLFIIGDGPERANLERLVEKLSLQENVIFVGQKSKLEVADYMRQSDMLALTSLWENQPVVILEALASGLPVLAPKIGGIPDILPPMCGQLVEPGDIPSIREGLAYMIENLPNYPSQPIAGYARERFSYAVVGKSFSDIYERVKKEAIYG